MADANPEEELLASCLGRVAQYGAFVVGVALITTLLVLLFRLNPVTSLCFALGIVYLVAAIGQPRGVFTTVRNLDLLRLIEDDTRARGALAVLSAIMFVLAVLFTRHPKWLE